MSFFIKTLTNEMILYNVKITTDHVSKYVLLVIFSLTFVFSFHEAYAFVLIGWTDDGFEVSSLSLPNYYSFNISYPDALHGNTVSVFVDLSDEIAYNGSLGTPSPGQTITVHITSNDDPVGVDYVLTEDADTGTFAGTNFVFLEGNYKFSVNDTVQVFIDEDPLSTCGTDNVITTLDSRSGGPSTGITVYSETDNTGMGLLLTESSPNSCHFVAKLHFTTAGLSNETTGTIKVALGDIISFYDNLDGDFLNAIITPIPAGKGAIQASFDDPDSDLTAEVIVTYLGNDAGIDLNDDGAPGRGGGGLIKPGLVLDAILSIFTGGDSFSKFTPPTLGLDVFQRRIVENGFSFNDNPIDVQQYYTPYPLITTQVGQNNTIKLKIYEERGLDNIAHVGVSYGLGKGEIFNEGRATIEFDRKFDGTETVTTFDPKHVLGNVTVTTNTVQCREGSSDNCLEVSFLHQFRAPLEYNMVATNIWDHDRNGWQNFFNHGIEIVGNSMNPPEQYDGIYKGHIYRLTETGKNTAIDDDGNSWTFDKIWNRDYILTTNPDTEILNPQKISAIKHLGYTYSDGEQIFGVNRLDHRFANEKEDQAIIAQNTMSEICQKCLDRPYDKINDIFSYDMPPILHKLDNSAIVEKMHHEEKKASDFLDALFNNLYPGKVMN